MRKTAVKLKKSKMETGRACPSREAPPPESNGVEASWIVMGRCGGPADSDVHPGIRMCACGWRSFFRWPKASVVGSS